MELPVILQKYNLLTINFIFCIQTNLKHPLRSMCSKVDENFSKYLRELPVSSSQPERLSHFKQTEHVEIFFTNNFFVFQQAMAGQLPDLQGILPARILMQSSLILAQPERSSLTR